MDLFRSGKCGTISYYYIQRFVKVGCFNPIGLKRQLHVVNLHWNFKIPLGLVPGSGIYLRSVHLQ